MRVREGLLAISAAAVLGLGASAAHADGYIRGPGYRVPAPFSWTGFYIGGHVGGAWSQVDWANVSLTNERVNNDSSGFIGGGQVGFNWQVGNIVLGVEGTYSATNLGDTATSTVNPAAVTYHTDIDNIGTVTGRLGFAADKFLIYAKGGWAIANVEVSGRDTALPDRFSFSHTQNGWTVGAGVEYMLSRNISLGAEYAFIDLGSHSFTGTTVGLLPVTIRDVDTQIHSVTGRLNFRFYRDEIVPPLK
jgi:outer membrane immunogenic protein